MRCQGGGRVEDPNGGARFSTAGSCSAALGVLLLTQVPEMDRYLLLSELWAHGQ